MTAATLPERTTGDLAPDEYVRYSRHLILPEIGVSGQRALRRARVLLVGAGGLGSPAALYLAAAGVGTIGLVDFDEVDVSNLQRQVLHGTSDVGRSKLDSARDRLADINPGVHVEGFPVRLTAHNAREIATGFDLVLDGTDNFATRYLVNDLCVLLGVPNVYGSIFRFDGQASVFATEQGPCYRCLYREPPPAGLVPACAEGGVLGVLPGLVGTIQATEAIKLITGAGTPLIGRLLLIDALHWRQRTVRVRRDPSCPACGTRQITDLTDAEQLCAVTVPDEIDAVFGAIPEMEPAALSSRLAAGDVLEIVDVREPHEWEIARIDGARLIPLASLESRIAELPADREIVVHCKAGGRSAQAVRRLRAAGFKRVWNLAGGIQRWSRDVDPSVPSY
jgi:molybdopterin/thiamine biosynthesis adenylyltransferase/rhodanese-related sulfurtransferase